LINPIKSSSEAYLSISNDAHIVTINDTHDGRLGISEHFVLSGHRRVDEVELHDFHLALQAGDHDITGGWKLVDARPAHIVASAAENTNVAAQLLHLVVQQLALQALGAILVGEVIILKKQGIVRVVHKNARVSHNPLVLQH
jgi:hypothetical protein